MTDMSILYIVVCALITVPGVIFPGIFAIRDHKEEIKWGQNDRIQTQRIRIDRMSSEKAGRKYILFLVLCEVSATLQGWECYMIKGSLDIFYAVFVSMMMSAVFMDLLWKEIYDFVWVIALAAETAALFFGGGPDKMGLASMAIYFVIQEAAMAKVYGRADSHAFCCSAVAITASGGGIEYYTLHMSVTWVLLAAVQTLRGNITKKLKLRQPVAMVPYISFSLSIVMTVIQLDGRDFVHFS